MPSSMKSVCEGCGGEILYETNSTGEEIIEADPDDYTNLCGTCRATQHDSKVENAEAAADFEDDRNRAMRTGGE